MEEHPAAAMAVPLDSDIERRCLIPLLAVQGLILFILGTGQVAGGMTTEAEEGTMDYMRLSPMTPLAKVLGYLFGLPVREWFQFAVTLPFTAWALWKGQVPAENWVPVYAVVIVAALLYHLTGLTAGTVMRNRRWAFLVTMGSVFLLYTILPQLGKLGLVYFEYLTIWPVLAENMPGFVSSTTGAAVAVGQKLLPDVRFFNLGFPEVAFTIFSQLVLCLTFILMLQRRWKASESHLLGKAWATGLYAWIHIVLLGCSLPLISTGLLFISNRLAMRLSGTGRNSGGWSPDLAEAISTVSVYGVVTLLALLLMGLLTAPSEETQARGLRRAIRHGLRRGPFFSDEAPSLWFVIVMALTGAAGWTVFAQAIVSSHWFPGQLLPAWTFAAFAVVLLTTSLCATLLYETRGPKGLFLGIVFIGVLPILASTVMGAASERLATAAVWVGSASPLVAPVNAVATVLPDGLAGQDHIRLAGPRAFVFWQSLMVVATVVLIAGRRKSRTVPMPGPGPAADSVA